MNKNIKIFDLKDPAQYDAEKKFWNNASMEFKINALEEIRESYFKLFKINKDETSKRLRRFYKVTERKRS